MKHTITFNLDIDAAKAEFGEPMDEVGYTDWIAKGLTEHTPGVTDVLVSAGPQPVYILERHDDSYRAGGESHVHGIYATEALGLQGMYESITMNGEFKGQNAVAEHDERGELVYWSYMDDDGFETILSRYTIDN